MKHYTVRTDASVLVPAKGEILGGAAALVFALFGAGCFDPTDSAGDTETSGATGTAGDSSAGPPTTASGSQGSASASSNDDDSGPGDTTASTTPGDTTDTTDPTESTSTTAPGDGGSTGATTGGGDPVCGDGQVDAPEACDDGVNAGAVAGDCAPDCSKEVEEKIIRLSQNTVAGNFALGRASFVAAADSECPVGYLAMIADGIDRVGSLAPLMGNGQVDWPIQTWTSYVNPAGDPVWTTTDLRLLGVADDHTWAGLANPVAPAGGTAFTAMVEDYTTSSLNCLSFTVDAGTSGDNRAAFGQATLTTQGAIGSGVGLGGGCAFARSLYCVEQ